MFFLSLYYAFRLKAFTFGGSLLGIVRFITFIVSLLCMVAHRVCFGFRWVYVFVLPFYINCFKMFERFLFVKFQELYLDPGLSVTVDPFEGYYGNLEFFIMNWLVSERWFTLYSFFEVFGTVSDIIYTSLGVIVPNCYYTVITYYSTMVIVNDQHLFLYENMPGYDI